MKIVGFGLILLLCGLMSVRLLVSLLRPFVWCRRRLIVISRVVKVRRLLIRRVYLMRQRNVLFIVKVILRN